VKRVNLSWEIRKVNQYRTERGSAGCQGQLRCQQQIADYANQVVSINRIISYVVLKLTLASGATALGSVQASDYPRPRLAADITGYENHFC
jgi:hypothetical protein